MTPSIPASPTVRTAPSPSVLVPIKDLAARLGLSHRALRHYEELGLVRSNRDFSNARHYDGETIATLAAIASLRRAGVSIPAIRSIIALRHDLPAYRQAIRETLTDIAARKQRDLAALRDLLGNLESTFAPLSQDASAS